MEILHDSCDGTMCDVRCMHNVGCTMQDVRFTATSYELSGTMYPLIAISIALGLMTTTAMGMPFALVVLLGLGLAIVWASGHGYRYW